MAWRTNLAFRESFSQISIGFLNDLLAEYPKRDFQLVLWDGTVWGVQERPRFTVVLRHPGALRAMFLNPSELALGEAYISDDFDIEGDVEAAFDLADYLLGQERGVWKNVELAEWLRKLPKSDHARTERRPAKLWGLVHSKNRDRQAISYHYDLPTEFYALWLDERMVYSCALFGTPADSLETAQERKLDYICRKLRLRRGDCLLDIGCGWGGLLMYAVTHYGVQAMGITLSAPQADLARQRIRESGLNDRCRVEVCDYRDLKPTRRYDKLVSVGMFEHVGEALLPQYFNRAWSLVRPGGVFLNHGIAYSATYRRRGPSFTDRYFFPDGEMVPISTSLRAAEESGFEVRDVESLREHYGLTLHHWLKRLEAGADQVRNIVDDAAYRTWRMQMAGAAHAFRNGRLNLYQTLFAKPVRGNSGLPLTREDWYRT